MLAFAEHPLPKFSVLLQELNIWGGVNSGIGMQMLHKMSILRHTVKSSHPLPSLLLPGQSIGFLPVAPKSSATFGEKFCQFPK
jgi:hypothetical protein